MQKLPIAVKNADTLFVLYGIEDPPLWHRQSGRFRTPHELERDGTASAARLLVGCGRRQ